MSDYPRVAGFGSVGAFKAHLAALGLDLPCADELITGSDAPLGQPMEVDGFTLGNRFCIHPMEGWDGTLDGRPTPHTIRRWERFGLSGAKLIWGGEAVAVRHDGRANPNQLWLAEHTREEIGALRTRLVEVHREHHGRTDDLVVGLQLTHSGRFCRPNDHHRLEPRIAYHHPVLDRKFGLPADYPVLTDAEIRAYIADYGVAARTAFELGYDFIDLKHCHGYLGHELLSAFERPGPFGGSFQNRTRYLCELVETVRRAAPDLRLGVRLSAFDLVAFRPDPEHDGADGKLGRGVPEPFDPAQPY